MINLLTGRSAAFTCPLGVIEKMAYSKALTNAIKLAQSRVGIVLIDGWIRSDKAGTNTKQGQAEARIHCEPKSWIGGRWITKG